MECAFKGDSFPVYRPHAGYLVTLSPPVQSFVLLADYRGAPCVTLERRGKLEEDRWAIVDRPAILNSDLEWEYEPQPSSRDEEFFARSRFSFEAALDLWGKALEVKETIQRYPKPSFVFQRIAQEA